MIQSSGQLLEDLKRNAVSGCLPPVIGNSAVKFVRDRERMCCFMT